MDYAKQLERIEAKKAKDRKNSNLKNSKTVEVVRGPHRENGKTRDIVGKASGFGSGRTYARAKYIYENADFVIVLYKLFNCLQNEPIATDRPDIYYLTMRFSSAILLRLFSLCDC